jgi:hypothetical protein
MKAFITFLLLLAASTLTLGQSLMLGVSDPIDIRGAGAQYAIAVPVILRNGVDFDKIVPFSHPSNVKFDKTLDKSLKDAITVDKDAQGPNIILTLTMASFTRQGIYEVHIGYKNDKNDQEDLTVKLSLPAATLDTVPMVNIDYTSGNVQAGAFILHEMGNKIPITGLKLPPPFFTNAGEGRLVYFDDAPVTVPAGGWMPFRYSFDKPNIEKLDFGHHYGKMYLYSDQLSGPVVVVFDLWRRRQRWTIILIIALGLAVGFVVRHVLKDNKEYEQVRYNGLQTLYNMKTQLNKVGDPKFKTAMQSVVDTLESELQKTTGGISVNTAATLQAAITQATTGYSTARTALQTAIDAQQTTYTELAFTYENPSIPPVLKQCLSASAQLFQEFKDLLFTAINPAAAGIKASAILQQAQQDFTDYISFLKDVTAFLAGGKYYLSETPSTLKNSFNTAVQAGQAAIPPTPISIQTAADVTGLFKKTVGIESGFNKLITELDQNYQYIYKETNEAASNDPDFKTAYNKYISSLTTIVTDSSSMIPASTRWNPKVAAAVDTAWTTAGSKYVTTLGDADLSGIPGLTKALTSQVPPHTVPATNTGVPEINIENQLKSTRLRFYLFAVTQTVFLMILLGLAGYNFYGTTYSGTYSEIFTIFWLAFSTDITLDSVLAWKDKKG